MARESHFWNAGKKPNTSEWYSNKVTKWTKLIRKRNKNGQVFVLKVCCCLQTGYY